MKHLKQLLLLSCISVLMSCSDKNYIIDSTTSNMFATTESKVEWPSPNSKLFGTVTLQVQDSVKKKLAKKSQAEVKELATRSTSTTNRHIFYPQIEQSSIQFIPILNWNGTEFSTNKEKVCFYGTNKQGQTIYYAGTYETWTDSVTPNTNRRFYDATVKTYGQAFADRMIRELKNRSESDKWSLVSYADNSINYDLFEYAKQHSDNGKFFILTTGKRGFHICFLQNNKILTCKKIRKDADIKVQSANGLIR